MSDLLSNVIAYLTYHPLAWHVMSKVHCMNVKLDVMYVISWCHVTNNLFKNNFPCMVGLKFKLPLVYLKLV